MGVAPDTAINTATDAKLPTLSSAFFRAAFTDGNLRHFYDINPAQHNVITRPGDTLYGIAAAHRAAMNIENPANAAYALALQNNLIAPGGRWQDVRLQTGQSLTIPVAKGMEIIAMPMTEGYTTKDITAILQADGRLPPSLQANPDRAANVIGVLNPALGNPSITSMANAFFSPARVDIFALVRDDFADVSPLQTPGIVKGANTMLMVSEPQDSHMITVLDFARSYSRALTADGEKPPQILAYAEADFGDTLLGTLESLPPTDDKASDYLILNHSYSFKPSVTLQEQMLDSAYTDLKAIHIMSAGNHADVVSPHRNENVAMPYQLGPRSYVVGAAHTTVDGLTKLADYSSVGADIVAPPVALHNGDMISGTSFSSPMMAALNQKMLQLYGGTLTQEEIIAAAYMSTSMNLIETDPQRARELYVPGNDSTPVDVVFETNGGGRPHNDRAGAGMIDPQKWQENLNLMAGIKMRMEHVPAPARQDYDIGLMTPVEGRDILGDKTFTYTIRITEDMTLGRIALVLPQEGHFDNDPAIMRRTTDITSPSGFTFDMPITPHGTVGTDAFALEDVKAGDEITIVTHGQPLSELARVVINGQGDGNVIQATRDQLMEMGKMPSPLTEYAGDRLKSEVDAEAAAARAALEKSRPVLPDLGLQNILTNPVDGALPPLPAPNIKF